MNHTELLFSVDDGIAKISLNRPASYNAISDTMREELREVLSLIADSEEIDVVVLTGMGKAFCAGGDVKKMEENLGKRLSYDERLLTYRKDAADMVKLFQRVEQPIVAAINGHAFGAGCSIAMLCDYRIASDSAKFGLPFGKRGLVPDWGATYSLPRLVGLSNAIELVASGRTITATEAKQLGLVNRVVPSTSLSLEVHNLCKGFQSSGPEATRKAKLLMREALQLGAQEALEVEAQAQSERYCSSEHMEGVLSFLEKRAPKYRKG